jgi:type IV pilus assembly protein PilB
MMPLDFLKLSSEIIQVITPEQAWHYKIAPKDNNEIAMDFYIDINNYSKEIASELEILFGKNVTLEKCESEIISKTLSKFYRKNKGSTESNKFSSQRDDNFLIDLIAEAKDLGSSDIHIEIYDEKARIRVRIDGLLVERYRLEKYEYPVLINKIKIKANLDIAEKRLPQDGRILFETDKKKFDLRVSVLPTLYGEKVVLRILSNDATKINIEELGFSKNELKDYLEGIKKPHGIVLISGPTGSGKTTTLYATLKILNEDKRNILTVEDPVEYTLDGINQVQLRENIGLNFASTMRTFLRQDPDVIMVGEIRDAETAQMAIRAALTGHLVLSTIHTNSAWGTISRLVDMGIPAFLIASTLNTTVAQRLVRKLCGNCKKKEMLDHSLLPINYLQDENINDHFVAVGCENCHHTGYKGRMAIYEVINIDKEISELVKKNEYNISEVLINKEISTLSNCAFNLFKKGITSLDEVYPILLNN